MIAATAFLLLAPHSFEGKSFNNFESSQVRPIVVSQDGQRLFALNTPDSRLVVYSLEDPLQPVLLQEIPVALEPVSLVERNEDELWVVGNLSDAISIVSLTRGAVIDTLYCKDEPCDVVFAGEPKRAFVSVAASKEVIVFDPVTRLEIARIPIFGEDPRALAVSLDGDTVWVAAFRSGNGTTVIRPEVAAQASETESNELPEPPKVAKIVDADDPAWQAQVDIELPDYDVFEIDANSLIVRTRYSGVGTILYGLVPDPNGQALWIANTNARNLITYEPGVRGHVIDSRVTRVQLGEQVSIVAFDLNPELEYEQLPSKRSRAIALSEPTALAFNNSGKTLFVAAFGTDRIGMIDGEGRVTGRIDVNPSAAGRIDPRQKRGPRGLAQHPSRDVLYVLNRISNNVAVVDTSKKEVLAEIEFENDPTPQALRENRGFLYDAKLSGNGSFSCGSCHVDGDLDGLAWNLGDPGGKLQAVPDPRVHYDSHSLHPMKGPMTTQTLRGLAGQAPYHWRGDKPKLEDFNPAFDGLMGGEQLDEQDMFDFARFMESIEFPPNPNLQMNRMPYNDSGVLSAMAGFEHFMSVPFAPTTRCVGCHKFPSGSDGKIVAHEILDTTQAIKTPHLRNVYRRLGRNPIEGQSTSGFGLFHDGTFNTVFDILSKPVFRSISTDPEAKTRLENFVLSFDTGTAPAVGYARTVTAANRSQKKTIEYLTLMMEEAKKADCDWIAQGSLDGHQVGFSYLPESQSFRTDRTGQKDLSLEQLLARLKTPTDILTFMGVPPGAGLRMGIDRDLDGALNRD